MTSRGAAQRRIDFAFAIEKVGEKDDRTVTGWATAACLDKQRDLIPFDVAVRRILEDTLD